jgi:hypothetical protein
MQKTAMSQDFGWQPSTARYISVYRDALNAAPLHSPLADFERNPSPNTFRPGQGARAAKVSEDAVRKRSYEIWQREGCPDGLADQHWFRAIAELEGEFAAENSSIAGSRIHDVRPRPHVTHPPQKLAAGRH